MGFKKNVWKSLFLATSVVMLNLAVYGYGRQLMMANFIGAFIMSLVANIAVDIIYYIVEKKRELRKPNKPTEEQIEIIDKLKN